MMRKTLLHVIVIILLVSSACKGLFDFKPEEITIEIEGYVKDYHNKNPINNATIKLLIKKKNLLSWDEYYYPNAETKSTSTGKYYIKKTIDYEHWYELGMEASASGYSKKSTDPEETYAENWNPNVKQKEGIQRINIYLKKL
ncbi:hypothetical protein BVY01_02590 [bacterium I07]|nr:hypothetical protein BVY01_02590 [bacterium I07]